MLLTLSVYTEGGDATGQKGERALKPAYSTQGAAAADGRDLEDADVEKGLPVPGQDQTDKISDIKTVSLSQVDAPTLAEFEVPPTCSDNYSFLQPADCQRLLPRLLHMPTMSVERQGIKICKTRLKEVHTNLAANHPMVYRCHPSGATWCYVLSLLLLGSV